MFKRLRLRLTVVCACGTALVLAGMALAGLRFSLTQLERQSQESFRSNVNAILLYLGKQPSIDQAWLAQTEADNALWIRIESSTTRLQFTQLNSTRNSVTAQAVGHAATELGFDPLARPSSSLEADMVQFTMESGGESYLACVASVPAGQGWIGVTIVKDQAGELRAATTLKAGFGLCALAATALLMAFAWLFAGRAIRPVEENHQRQIDFTSAASHELRSPLAVIEMSAGTIRRIPSQAAGLAGKIEKECRQMTRLVDDLLLLARADRQKWGITLASASPKTILLSAAERFELLAREKGVNLEVNLPREILPQIECDRGRIEQALAIFMENALRFTPPGGFIRLSACLERQRVCFSVADSGPGIPEANRLRVFDRFYQADTSRTDKEHYGLGLSIAREIARLHKGRVSAGASSLGGAELQLQLPFTPKQNPAQ